ncbi:MAG: branched-chain amino acid ABC transporter permease [Alphaproteobacteria bacterium]|nr:branched-chain amino acid ABC transporter permease [Alphaproteobacteria bacterium]
MFVQQLFNALVLGSVYALFALGFTLTFGVLRVINLMYGFYFAAGAYLALFAVQELAVPLWGAVALGVVGSAVLGVVCDGLLLSRLRATKAPELSSLMVTLGGVLLFNSLMNLMFGAEVRRFPAGALSFEAITLGPLRAAPIQFIIIAVVFVLVTAVFLFIARTRIGAALRAVAERPDTAALMGVNVGGIVGLTSGLSAALAGGAGILVGLNLNAVQPYMGESLMLRGFAVIIIGGLGDIRGALVAGLGLGLLEVMTAGYVSSTLKEAVAFSALILALWLRPGGLFGWASGKRA